MYNPGPPLRPFHAEPTRITLATRCHGFTRRCQNLAGELQGAADVFASDERVTLEAALTVIRRVAQLELQADELCRALARTPEPYVVPHAVVMVRCTELDSKERLS